LGGSCDMAIQTTEHEPEPEVQGITHTWYQDAAMDLLEDFGPYIPEFENDHILELTTHGEITLIDGETGHLNRRIPLYRRRSPYERPTCVGCTETIHQGQPRIRCPKCKNCIHQKCGGMIYANKGGYCLYCNNHPIFDVPRGARIQTLQREIDLLRRTIIQNNLNLPEEPEEAPEDVIVIRDPSPEPSEPPRSIYLSPSPETPQDPRSPQSQIGSDTESVTITSVTRHTDPVTRQSKREHKIYQAIITAIHDPESTDLAGTVPQEDEAGIYWYYAKYHEGQGHKNIAQSLLNYMKLGKKLEDQKNELIQQGYSERGAEVSATRWAANAFQNAGNGEVTQYEQGETTFKARRAWELLQGISEEIITKLHKVTPWNVRKLKKEEAVSINQRVRQHIEERHISG